MDTSESAQSTSTSTEPQGPSEGLTPGATTAAKTGTADGSMRGGVGAPPENTTDATAKTGDVVAPPGSSTYCHACGDRVDPRAFVCPKCGVKQQRGGNGEGIEPGLAAVVTLITSPVIGMLLVKRWGLAALYAVVIFFGILTAAFLIGIPILLGAWLVGIFHVYSIANRDRNG